MQPSPDDPLLRHADGLVQSARIHSISACTVLLEEFPFIKHSNIESLDFFLTVAGVFMAATRLSNLRVGEAREEHLMNKVYDRFVEWDKKNAVRAFDDCKTFFERNFDALTNTGHDPRFVASDAIGGWIAWNVLERAPQTEEERKLVRAVGSMTVHIFFNWWTEGKSGSTAEGCA
jgi:hypothetical protein